MDSENSPTRRFFVLQDEFSGNDDTRFDTVNPNVGDAPRCPRCGNGRGARAWLPPYRAELQLHGKGYGDFVTGPGGDLLVSERFVDKAREEKLVGLSGFHPVEIVRVLRKRRGATTSSVPRYFFVVPAFAQAAVDEERSKLHRLRPYTCDECRLSGLDAIRGFSLEEGSWKGEDVFRPRGLAGTLVASERFAHFVVTHGLTNMRLVPTEQYVWDPLGRSPAG
jgi:hypothetical protein